MSIEQDNILQLKKLCAKIIDNDNTTANDIQGSTIADVLNSIISNYKSTLPKKVELNTEQSPIYLNNNHLAVFNNSYRIGNHFIIDINIRNSSNASFDLSSNNPIVFFNEEDLLSLSDEQIATNMYCLTSVTENSQNSNKNVTFSYLGYGEQKTPVGVIVGDAGFSIPAYKVAKIFGVIVIG